MNMPVTYSHRQQASEDFRGMSEGVLRALDMIKQAKDDEQNRADRAMARQIQQSQLASAAQQQEAGALQLKGAKEEDRLLGNFNDITTRQATPGAFGPETAGEAALPSPLSTRGRGEAFKDSIIAQIRTRRDPSNPVTADQIGQERTDKATARTQGMEEFGLRKGQITAATEASKAATAHSAIEDAKTKRETELLGKPKPPDPGDALEVAKFARQLNQDFMGNQLTKDFQVIERTKGQMEQSYSAWKERAQAAEKDGKTLDRGAIDQTLITLFNKLLDPSSVVRESEYARTPEGMAFLTRVQGQFQKFQEGGAGISPQFMDELINSAGVLTKAAEDGFAKHAQDAMATAQSYGIAPERVVGGYARYLNHGSAAPAGIPGVPAAGPSDDDIIAGFRKKP